jgi:energy-coupling factor transporter ATP-binding protein EcfA2
MKIHTLQFGDVGPLLERKIEFTDDWSGEVNKRVLFSGPNGCGKSTALRAVATLWEAAGYWLEQRKTLPRTNSAREWLQRWGGVAVVLVDTGLTGPENQPIGLIFGVTDWCEARMAERGDVLWLGESVARSGKPGNPKRDLFVPQGDWLEHWSDARKKMILGFEPTDLPNVIFMDAEERRWIAPKRNVGEHLAEQPVLRWSPRYVATDDWRGQLEASLINLKVTRPKRFFQVLEELNLFLVGKKIESDIKPGENRLRVKLAGQRGQYHTLDELSAGEHQVLIILYVIARWGEKGCLVLIDEPDLYLHPSLISGLLSRIEHLVDELGGQLLISSHVPDVWSRFESTGRRIDLGGVNE